MKVLHVIPGIASRYGGPGRAVLATCLALKCQGVETLIATTDVDGPGRLPVDLARPITYRGVQVIFFPYQWSEAFKYSRPLGCWLEANVRHYDLLEIHAIFSHSSLAAARSCRRHGVPYVVRPLGSLDPWSLKQKRLRKRILWHIGVKQMLRGAAAIHYTTEEERRLAEHALGLKHGAVVPLGVDEDILKIPVNPDDFREHYRVLGKDPYMLALCRIDPKKGLELLLDSFLDLIRQKEFQHWRLVVAGDGEAGYVASLRRFVGERKGNSHVLFTGWLDGVIKIAALKGAALFVLPSFQENFGLAVVEAMACGVPVLISTHVNLANEIRAAGAGWIEILDRSAFSQTLAEALRDERERVSRGAAGRELVRARYTWSTVASELADLYRSIRIINRSPGKSGL